MSHEQIAERVELGNIGINIAEAKANLSRILNELGEEPAFLNVRNKPRAVVLDINTYLAIMDKPEAYEILLAAEEAAAEPSLTLEEFEQEMDKIIADLDARSRVEAA